VAAEIASGSPDEDAGLSGIGRLALDALKDLIDLHVRKAWFKEKWFHDSIRNRLHHTKTNPFGQGLL
jgi:hypothetical protein